MVHYFSVGVGGLLWLLGAYTFRKAFGKRVCVFGRIMWGYLAGVLMGIGLYLYFAHGNEDLAPWFLIAYLLFIIVGLMIIRRTILGGLTQLDNNVLNFFRAMVLRHRWQHQPPKATTHDPEVGPH